MCFISSWKRDTLEFTKEKNRPSPSNYFHDWNQHILPLLMRIHLHTIRHSFPNREKRLGSFLY